MERYLVCGQKCFSELILETLLAQSTTIIIHSLILISGDANVFLINLALIL